VTTLLCTPLLVSGTLLPNGTTAELLVSMAMQPFDAICGYFLIYMCNAHVYLTQVSAKQLTRSCRSAERQVWPEKWPYREGLC